jgi:hypothetical protein
LKPTYYSGTTWDASTTYNRNDAVVVGGVTYYSAQNGNIGHYPVFGGWWSLTLCGTTVYGWNGVDNPLYNSYTPEGVCANVNAAFYEGDQGGGYTFHAYEIHSNGVTGMAVWISTGTVMNPALFIPITASPI